MSTGFPASPDQPTSSLSPSEKLAFQVPRVAQSMNSRQTEFPQSGLSSLYPPFARPQSEGSFADQASAAQFTTPPQGPRSQNFSSSATPTSEYGVNPPSARSGSFPEYIQRSYHPANQGATPQSMAQASSPSISLPAGQTNNDAHNIKSDTDVPIDPSIASSPSYNAQSQYSPYPSQHEFPGHPQTSVFTRPEWAGGPQYHGHPGVAYGPTPSTSGQTASSNVSPVQRPPGGGHPLSTVYSFVPIPGSQQHKRPRRRYEEIERMYKCGWKGCEKAYGTLNHLNAHVMMQAHGPKRAPEEFKEIRKEWRAKKKEDDTRRKTGERQPPPNGRPATESSSESTVYGQMRTHGTAPQMGGPQLPPIGYTPAGSATHYNAQSPPMEGIGPYSATNNSVQNNGNAATSTFPPPPYTQGNQMYQRHSSFQRPKPAQQPEQNPATDNGPNNFQE